MKIAVIAKPGLWVAACPRWPNAWGHGLNAREAIGDLIVQHGAMIGVEVFTEFGPLSQSPPPPGAAVMDCLVEHSDGVCDCRKNDGTPWTATPTPPAPPTDTRTQKDADASP